MKKLIKKLWFQVILGMILGVCFGLLLSPSAFALVSSEIAFKIAPWIALIGNILAFVILAIFAGVVLINLKEEQSKPLIDLAKSLQAFSMKIVEWAMKLAPYAVFGLICSITIKIGFDAISSMFMYVFTVLFGLFLVLCYYLSIVYLVSKMKPMEFFGKIKEVQLMAFSTSSSAAVMPLSIKTAEEKLNISPSISKFVIPLGL